MIRVFNFSGGKSSALMTILGQPQPEDIVLFLDTKREHPKTYKFLDDFEAHEGIKIHRVTYTHAKAPGLEGFDAMLSRERNYLPNKMHRMCTRALKINLAKRYLRPLIGMEYEQHIGYRADEQHRIVKFRPNYKKCTPRFILAEKGINKAMVNQYWLSKTYTLEMPAILGNCDLCFLKGKGAIINILTRYPELADKWISDEEQMTIKSGGNANTYFSDITYRQLLHIAQSQKTLFDGMDIDKLTPAYSCSCTNF